MSAPLWTPPAHLERPVVVRFPLERGQWCHATEGRFPNLALQSVALRLAYIGDQYGQQIRPGIEHLCEVTCLSRRPVIKAMVELWRDGWIILEHRGTKRLGQANEYRLSAPAPLWAEFDKLGDRPHWIEWEDWPAPEWMRPPYWNGQVV